MGWNPETQQLQELNSELLKEFTDKNWPVFKEGEIVMVRPQVDMGSPFKAKFRISEIRDNRMVLVAVGAPKEVGSGG